MTDNHAADDVWAFTDDICGRGLNLDGAVFTCNLQPMHPEPRRHQAQGDVPVRFTLTWRERA